MVPNHSKRPIYLFFFYSNIYTLKLKSISPDTHTQQFISDKAKKSKQISKKWLQETKAFQVFQKTNTYLTLIHTRTY